MKAESLTAPPGVFSAAECCSILGIPRSRLWGFLEADLVGSTGPEIPPRFYSWEIYAIAVASKLPDWCTPAYASRWLRRQAMSSIVREPHLWCATPKECYCLIGARQSALRITHLYGDCHLVNGSRLWREVRRNIVKQMEARLHLAGQ